MSSSVLFWFCKRTGEAGANKQKTQANEKFFIVVTKEKKIVGPPGPTEWAPRRKEKEICKLRYVLVNV